MWNQLSSGLAKVQKYADVDAIKEKARQAATQFNEFTQEVLQDIEESEQVAKANIEKYRAEKHQRELEATQAENHPETTQTTMDPDANDSSSSLTAPSGGHFGDTFANSFASPLFEAQTNQPSYPVTEHFQSNGFGVETTTPNHFNTHSGLFGQDLTPVAQTHTLHTSSSGGHSTMHHIQNDFDSTDGLMIEPSNDVPSLDVSLDSTRHDQPIDQSHTEVDLDTPHGRNGNADTPQLLAQIHELQRTVERQEAQLREQSIAHLAAVQQLQAEAQANQDAMQRRSADHETRLQAQVNELNAQLHQAQQQLQQANESLHQQQHSSQVSTPAASSTTEADEESIDVSAVMSDLTLSLSEKLELLRDEILLLQERLAKRTAAATIPAAAPIPSAAATTASTADTDSRLQSLQDTIDELQSQVESLTDEKSTLTEILSELKQESEQSVQAIVKEGRERELDLEKRLTQSNEEVNSLKLQLDMSSFNAGSAAHVLSLERQEIDRLQTELAQAQQELHGLHTQHDVDAAALSELHHQLEASGGALNDSHASSIASEETDNDPAPLQTQSIETKYEALKNSHNKLTLFRSQAIAWKKQAEEVMYKLKARKEQIQSQQRQEHRAWAKEKQELLAQLQQARGEAPGSDSSSIVASPTTSGEAPVLAGVLDATQLLKQEHAASLSLIQAQLDLAKQQLGMQAEQITLLQTELQSRPTLGVGDSAQLTQEREEQIRAEYLPITDDLAHKLHEARALVEQKNLELQEVHIKLQRSMSELEDERQTVHRLQQAAGLAAQQAQSASDERVKQVTQEFEQRWANLAAQHTEELRNQVEQAEQANAFVRQEVAQLREINTKQQESIQQLSAQLSELHSHAQHLGVRAQQGLEAEQQLLKAHADEQHHIAQFNEVNSLLIATKGELEQMKGQLNQTQQESYSQIEQLRHQLQQAHQLLESQQAQSLPQIDASSNESALNQANEQLTSEIAKVKEQAAEQEQKLQAHAQDQEQKLQQLTEQLHQAQQQLQEAQEHLHQQQQQQSSSSSHAAADPAARIVSLESELQHIREQMTRRTERSIIEHDRVVELIAIWKQRCSHLQDNFARLHAQATEAGVNYQISPPPQGVTPKELMEARLDLMEMNSQSQFDEQQSPMAEKTNTDATPTAKENDTHAQTGESANPQVVQELAQAKEQLIQQQQSLQQLTTQLTDVHAHAQNLATQVQQGMQAQQQLLTVQQQLLEAQMQVQQQAIQLKEVTGQLASAQAQLAQVQSQPPTPAIATTVPAGGSDDVVNNLRAEVERLQQKNASLNDQANTMIGQLNQRYEQLLTSFKALQAQCRDGLQGEDGNLALIADLRAAVAKGEASMAQSASEIESLKSEVRSAEKTKGELQIMGARWREAMSEADGLRTIVKEQALAMNEMRESGATGGASGDSNGAPDSLNASPDAEEEIRRLRQQVQDLRLDAASMASLQSDYAALQRAHDMSQDMLNEARATAEDLRKALTEAQLRTTQLEREIEQLRAAQFTPSTTANGVPLDASSESLAKQLAELQQALQHKSAQLTEMAQYTSSIEQDNMTLRKSFEKTMAKLKQFSSEDHLVDRRLVVKMLVTFFERKDKDEVLTLMAKVLQFTPEDLARINKGRQGVLGMLGSFLAAPATPKLAAGTENLADQWIEFLMQESNKVDEPAPAAIQPPPSTRARTEPNPAVYSRMSEFEAPPTGRAIIGNVQPPPAIPQGTQIQQSPPVQQSPQSQVQPLASPPAALPVFAPPPSFQAPPVFQAPPPSAYHGSPTHAPPPPVFQPPLVVPPPSIAGFAVPPPLSGGAPFQMPPPLSQQR